MTTDECIISDQAKTIAHLRRQLEKKQNKAHPPGSAKKVFGAFWKLWKDRKLSPKELASLAFDAGHELWHEESK